MAAVETSDLLSQCCGGVKVSQSTSVLSYIQLLCSTTEGPSRPWVRCSAQHSPAEASGCIMGSGDSNCTFSRMSQRFLQRSQQVSLVPRGTLHTWSLQDRTHLSPTHLWGFNKTRIFIFRFHLVTVTNFLHVLHRSSCSVAITTSDAVLPGTATWRFCQWPNVTDRYWVSVV